MHTSSSMVHVICICYRQLLENLGFCLGFSPLGSLSVTDMQLRIAHLLLTLWNKQYIKHIDDFKIHISEVEHSSSVSDQE